MKRFRASLASSAFTLVEILVVIAIIAVLAAIIFPAISGAIKKGYQTTSMANLRNWYSAFTASVNNHNGELPLAGVPFDPGSEEGWFNRMPVEISERAYSKFDTDTQPRYGQKSIWVNPVVPKKDWATNGFTFNYGYNDLLVEKRDTAGDRPLRLASVQFPNITILMGEKADSNPNLNTTNVKAYYAGSDPIADLEGRANFLFCDGHVETVKRSVFTDSRATDDVSLDKREAPVSWLPYGKSVSKGE